MVTFFDSIKEPNRPICSSKIILRGWILLGPNLKAAELAAFLFVQKSAQAAYVRFTPQKQTWTE
jgi:hypothetical protein